MTDPTTPATVTADCSLDDDYRWALARDTMIIPAEELGEDMTRGLFPDEPPEDRYFAVYRRKTRSAPKAVNATVRRLLRPFEEPTTFVEAVMAVARAESESPLDVLRTLQPLVERFVRDGLIVRADGDAADPADVLTATLAPGSTVAGHTVLDNIRSVVDSEIYLVEQPDTHDRFVLKILRPECRADKTHRKTLRCFQNEIRVLRTLADAAPCRLHDHGIDDERCYAILERIDGVPVTRAARRLRQEIDEPRLRRRQLLPLATGCVAALAELHEHGFLHGDVQPGNYLADEHGRVRIIDFGLARKIDLRPGEARHVMQGGVLNYYSPELATATRECNRAPVGTVRGEVYQMGAMLYELLTGRPYLDAAPTVEETLRQIVEDPPVSFVNAGAPGWADVEAVLRRALAKDPLDRFESLRAFEAALCECTTALPAATPPPAVAPAVTEFVETYLDEVRGLTLDGLIAAHGDAPAAPIWLGGAGLAYALWRAAVHGDDPDLLALADHWAEEAMHVADAPHGLYSVELELTKDFVRAGSLFHARTGIALVQALVGHAMVNELAWRRGMHVLLEAAPETGEDVEVLMGTAGRLIGTTILWTTVGEGCLLDGGNALARHLLDTAGDDLARPWPQIGYNGFAHGLGGVLFALVQWSLHTGFTLPEWVLTATHALARDGGPRNGGTNWRVHRGRPDGREATAWCHGAPGLMLLWARAYELTGDRAFLAVCRDAGRHVLHDEESFANLCCGLTGHGYGLLALHRIDPDGTWLDAARRRAHRALATRTQTMWPHSLFKGQPGLLCLCLDVQDPGRSGFPCIEA